MKIVIAPDSFKESLSAPDVAAAIASGWQQVFPEAECLLRPMADGGEGTVDAVLAAVGGERRECRVRGPRGSRSWRTGAGLGRALRSLKWPQPVDCTVYRASSVMRAWPAASVLAS